MKDGLYEPQVSPVYAIAVQSESIWMLSGLKSGGMTLQGIRASEGDIQSYYKGHNKAISVIKLDDEERSALTGSWDKTVVDWDLETGKPKRNFTGVSGQISSIEWQPVGGSLVPSDIGEASLKLNLKGSFGISDSKNGNGIKNEADDDDDDMGSLFGDEEEEEGSGNEGLKQDTDGDIKMEGGDDKVKDSKTNNQENKKVNEISHSVFLSSSIDGIVDIWDRRQEKRVARIRPHDGVPPWSASACWSIDGNSIYVGRRNSCVDEYHIAKSVMPSRTFKFPTVSGAVSCVKPMPSGRHLLCASHDNLRIYDLKQSIEDSTSMGTAKQPVTPFYIIPGHHGGVISTIFVDPACQYMVTASGGRGWMGSTTDVALVYEITGLP